jgi:hypothetical protein
VQFNPDFLARLTRTTLGALALLCLLAPQAGWGQSRLDKAAQMLEQQARAGRGEFVTFLMGAASAYRWDSSAPQVAAAERAFCPPPWHTLDGKSYARIALEEYRRAKREYAALGEYPLDVLSLALQRGLRSRYPCTETTTQAEPQTTQAETESKTQ